MNAGVERLGSESRDARHLVGTSDQRDRQALLGARLGDVEAGPVIEHEARGERALAGSARHRGGGDVAPPQPPGAGQVDQQVQPSARESRSRDRGTCRAG